MSETSLKIPRLYIALQPYVNAEGLFSRGLVLFTKKDKPCFYLESRGVILFGNTAFQLPDGYKLDGEETIKRSKVVLLRFINPPQKNIEFRKDLVVGILDRSLPLAGFLFWQGVNYES